MQLKMSKFNKISCINFANQIKTDNGLSIAMFKDSDLDTIISFKDLWIIYGLFDLDKKTTDRVFDYQEKYQCLTYWAEQLFPKGLIDINFLHRKILNDDKTNFISKNKSCITSLSQVEFEINGKSVIGNCIDLVPFEIDSRFPNLDSISEHQITQVKVRDLIELAEKNLSYRNDNANKIALEYFKRAYELKPENKYLKHQVNLLDKIVNYKDYNYLTNKRVTEKFIKLFVECCNEKGVAGLYDIISEDFVCITQYFGKTKQGFIDSIYYERLSMVGLWTECNIYQTKDEEIPCVKLNDYGVFFFNIENNKIVRVFEYKIGEQIDRKKLKKMNNGGC